MIERHAQQFPAEEVCGLLAGKDGIAELALRTLNAAQNPAAEYQIAPAELFAAMHAIRGAGMQFMGIYHSHPNGSGEPSERDLAEANYPDVAYVIATLLKDGTADVRAFAIRDGAAEKMAIEIASGGSSPAPSARRR